MRRGDGGGVSICARYAMAVVVVSCTVVSIECAQQATSDDSPGAKSVVRDGAAEQRTAPRAPEGAPGAFVARWTHVAETSAVIWWRLPSIEKAALSYVEYGESASYGSRTAPSREARWAHFHRLAGLKAGCTYHYRMVNVEADSKGETRSEDLMFATARNEALIRLPGDRAGPPYVLDEEGAGYILTRDVTAPGSAFQVTAINVTLDLDGHTVVFGDETTKQVSGVAVTAKGPVSVCNGHIVDGRRCKEYSAAIQARYRTFPITIFGISTDIHNRCCYPIKLFGRCKGATIHHNDLYSRVTELESRHYPGNDIIRMDGIDGDVHVHDNLLTEGCHIGMRIGRPKTGTPTNVEIHHNDIRHHQQYVNGYAFAVSCPGADIHHNKVTSTGRCVHLCGDGIRFHDNWCDTRGHMTLSDMPEKARPFKHRRVELHGMKFEGSGSKNCKVYGNFMRITQLQPADSQGRGAPAGKVSNGVYVRSVATGLDDGVLVDTTQKWEPKRWRQYWLKHAADKPAVKITDNDATTLTAPGASGTPGPYVIYMKWDYVPATPLNVACYDPNAMNEVYDNDIVALTTYRKTRHGGYGDSGQWASAIYFVGMKKGKADEGKYSIYIHDNRFKSNHIFVSGLATNMTIRVEKNTFTLVDDPPVAEGNAAFRRLGADVAEAIRAGENTFVGMQP